MTVIKLAGACALAFTALSGLVAGAAHADNPNDPAMRSAEARARDRAIIKRLNQEQLAYVRQRDAHYAEGWRAYRQAPRSNVATQVDYQRQMAAWRRAVRLCESGHYDYCAR